MSQIFDHSSALQNYLNDDRVKRLPGSGRSPEVVRKPLDAAAAPYASRTECGNAVTALLPRGEREEREGEHPRSFLDKGINQRKSLLQGTIQRNHNGDVFDAVTGEVLLGGTKLPIGVGCTSTGELWEHTIGLEVDRTSWLEGQSRDSILKEQSEDIARRLESQGINAYQSENNTTLVGLCSGDTEKTSSYRNSNMIPVQQSKNVHNMMKDLQFHADNSRNKKQLRMLVVSNGWVSLADYNSEHRAFTRRISKFAADPNTRANGIEVVYYNVENTIHRIDGVPYLNMHAHILIKSTRKLGPNNWQSFINWVKSRFPKGYVNDSRLRNVKECVKYVFKPCEFELLTDKELAELFHQQFKLKFFHPLGEIKELRKKMKKDGLKLVRMPTGRPDEWKWHMMPKAKANPKQDRNNSGCTKNIVLAVTNPMPKFSPRREPCIVVTNYDGNFEGLIKHRNLSDLREQAMRTWRARASMKHTTTTTVRKTSRGYSQFVDQTYSRTFENEIPELPDYPAHWELSENPDLTLGEASLPLNFQLLN